MNTKKLTFGTGSSIVVKECQICQSFNLEPILFLGFLPPVNLMQKINEFPKEQAAYPALTLLCKKCQLVQLGLVVDANILFPPEYPYTSGTTKILRENFAELSQEVQSLLEPKSNDLVVDIGSNDGTLLSNFVKTQKVMGIEPTNMANVANEKKIPTIHSFFNEEAVNRVLEKEGPAKIITATNVFAHIENVDQVVKNILKLLSPKGVFISESHYLHSLIETLQYDTIYHEHLRYYSLKSLSYLFNQHGLIIFHAKKIPTHGGSIRVYAARKNQFPLTNCVQEIMVQEEKAYQNPNFFPDFKNKVMLSKLKTHALLCNLKEKGNRIFGIGAPSRASTLINYVGIDEGIMEAVMEIKGSYKIGKYMPGTLIPVLEESKLYQEQPNIAFLLSWHIADELMPKIKQKGFKGDFLVPLPEPRMIKNQDIRI